MGYFGEFGEGANASIRFLQTVIKHEELDEITLISNIPGSQIGTLEIYFNVMLMMIGLKKNYPIFER